MSKKSQQENKSNPQLLPELIDTPIKVKHRTNASMFYSTHIQIKPLTAQQRFLLGSKFLAISFVAALFFVLIPILHFILVPLALIVGLVMFIQGLSTQEYRLETHLICPQCQKNFTLKAAPQNRWPIKENCPECRAEIIIEKL